MKQLADVLHGQATGTFVLGIATAQESFETKMWKKCKAVKMVD